MGSRIGTGLAALALLASGGIARAAPPAVDAGPPIDLPLDQDATSATLTQAPDNGDMQREYPKVALAMGLGADVKMTCKTLASGRLDDCHVVSETPEGLGFGAATVRTSVYFHVRPATRDGQPVEGQITIPMRWMTGGGRPPPPPLPLAPASPQALALARRILDLQGVSDRLQSQWRPFMEQQTAQMAGVGDATATRSLMEAYRLGLADASRDEMEHHAHELASRESEADLKAAATFFGSPAGRAWMVAEDKTVTDFPRDFGDRIGQAARTHYCPNGACPAASVKSVAATK